MTRFREEFRDRSDRPLVTFSGRRSSRRYGDQESSPRSRRTHDSKDQLWFTLITGPANGANVYFHFELLDGAQEVASAEPKAREEAPLPGRTKAAPTPIRPDLRDALVLVSCVKRKLPQAAPARLLYCSDLFTKARRLIEAQNARWFVLSALYGLVPPDRVVAPYDLTLNTMGVAERRSWAAKVFEAVELQRHRYTVLVAG